MAEPSADKAPMKAPPGKIIPDIAEIIDGPTFVTFRTKEITVEIKDRPVRTIKPDVAGSSKEPAMSLRQAKLGKGGSDVRILR
jgi:hypothetical protein